MTQAWQAAAFSAKTSRRVTVAQMTLSAALLFSGMATADNCKTITGTVSPLQPMACSVPGASVCFQGTFSGDLQGTFQSVLLSIVPVDPARGMLSFTARTVIQTSAPAGTVYTSDVGMASGCFMTTNGQTVCAYANEILTITSGDRAYKQAYGSINLSGPYMAGQPGVYQGLICNVKGDKDSGNDDKKEKDDD